MINEITKVDSKVLNELLIQLEQREIDSIVLYETIEDEKVDLAIGETSEQDGVGAWAVEFIEFADARYFLVAYCGGGYKSLMVWDGDEYQGNSEDRTIMAQEIISFIQYTKEKNPFVYAVSISKKQK